VELGIEAGLDGLEALHPDHEPAVEEMLLHLAAERGLLVSAGSDCHGPDDARRAIGKRRLPGPEWARLLASAKARRSEAGLPPPVAAE
jgi:3',5'-nucleoside bisphosphate phosphatase